jgi:hypothetical protein
MGPGTHIIQRILDAVQPKSHSDALALMHDIDYLIDGGDEDKIVAADQRAIDSAKFYTLEGVAMKLGLTIRSWLHLKIHDNKFTAIGNLLKMYVKQSKLYATTFSLLGVDLQGW